MLRAEIGELIYLISLEYQLFIDCFPRHWHCYLWSKVRLLWIEPLLITARLWLCLVADWSPAGLWGWVTSPCCNVREWLSLNYAFTELCKHIQLLFFHSVRFKIYTINDWFFVFWKLLRFYPRTPHKLHCYIKTLHWLLQVPLGRGRR